MAGALLLVNKNLSQLIFREKCDKLKQYINTTFGPYFKTIDFYFNEENSFLVHFKKDNSPKFYKDDRGNWLVYEGNVYALNETRVLQAPDLWSIYKKHGESFANVLDGHFVIKLFDCILKRYIVVNDFIKNRTNFWVETADVIMFTPFLILSAFIKKPQLDIYALNEYMWRYYIMSNRSMLKDVERMAPATFYKIKNNKVISKQYWTFPHQYTDISFEESVHKLSESLKESARLISADERKPIVEFTIGQDSRTVLSAFTNQKLSFDTAIYGQESFFEVPRVRDINARHNFKMHHILLQQDFVNHPWQHLKKSIILGSAEEPAYLMGRILHMREQYLGISSLAVNGVHGRYYKDGMWNEMYVMNLYKEPRIFKSDIFIKYRALNKNYPDDIFTKDYKEVKSNSKDYFREMIARSIGDYKNSPVAMQVDKFDMEHYAVFATAASTLCNFFIDLISPLLFRRNLEAALTMPVKWRYNLSKIQRAVVYKLDPFLAEEKTGFMDINMVPKKGLSFLSFLTRYWYGQSKKYREKLKNIMGFNVKTQLQKAWDYLPVYQNFYNDPEVRELLQYDNMALSSILEKEPWDNLIQQYDNVEFHTLERLEYILKLVTIEYFLKNASEINNNT